jgi:HEAT repeat protein
MELQRSGHPDAHAYLSNGILDDCEAVAMTCALSLAGTTDRQTVDRLIKATSFPSRMVAEAAATALAESGDPKVIEHFMTAFRHISLPAEVIGKGLRRTTDPDVMLALREGMTAGDSQKKLISALALNGRTDLESTILMATGVPAVYIAFSKACANGLFANPHTIATTALVSGLQHSSYEVASACAQSLASIRGEMAERALIARMRGSDSTVRTTCAAAMALFDSAEANAAHVSAISDWDTHVRLAATFAAGGKDDPEIIRALLQRFEDEASEVRIAAASALRRINNPDMVALLIENVINGTREVARLSALALKGQIG